MYTASTSVAWPPATNGPENEPGPLSRDLVGGDAQRRDQRVAVRSHEELHQAVEDADLAREHAQQALDDERVEDADAGRQGGSARDDREQHPERRPGGEDQPAAGEATDEEPRGRPRTSAPSAAAIAQLDTAPSA